MKTFRPHSYRSVLALFAAIISVGIASCVSVQDNYLSGTPAALVPQQLPAAGSATLAESRRATDSLLHEMSLRKRLRKHLRASELNQLYAQLGSQLQRDRCFHQLLSSVPEHSDSLTPAQYWAAAQLLQSASCYQAYYRSDKHIRRVINRGNVSYGIPRGILDRSGDFLYSPRVRKILQASRPKRKSSLADSTIAQLPATNALTALTWRLARSADRLYKLRYDRAGVMRFAFGTKVRRPKEPSQHRKNALALLPLLQPYDIILSKSPQHITDYFIPGRYGHAAIWFGFNIGRKDSPPARKRKLRVAQINNPAIAEVVRSGARFGSLKDFADGHEYVILRLKDISSEQKARILDIARKQIGKEYDFNFDIESSETLTCTELVYLAYDFIDWETIYTFGRFSIAPDNLLGTALSNGLFDIPYMVVNGAVIENPDLMHIPTLVVK